MPKPTPQPPALDRMIERLSRLPGIGKRSAQRIAFYLLKQPADETLELAAAIRDFKANLQVCGVCGNVAESDPCPICSDPNRNAGLVLVVEQPSDVASFEALGSYRGVYHVLMGHLAPLEGIGPGELNVQRLIERVKTSREPGRGAPGRQPGSGSGRRARITEVILGTNPTLEGDGTALYLSEHLGKLGVKVTRLARGLPTGSSLELASKPVLSDAIHGRQPMT